MRRVRLSGPNGVEDATVEDGVVHAERSGRIEPLDADRLTLPEPYRLLRPVDPPEVWCAGVTYERSRDARVEESAVQDVYTLVYDADRPELFLKDAGCRRTVGPGEPIGIRSDSSWNVPEPEIGLVVGAGGEIVGVTIGNDVSSREIEGANPLYLPQAKVYAGACALGPAVLSPLGAEPLEIRMRILSDTGQELFAGETSTARMKRTFEDLVTFLFAREPRPVRQRPAHRNRACSSRRVHARAGAARRDRGTRDRHPLRTLSSPPPASSKGASSMSDTLTETPAKNYVGGEWRESASGDSYEKRSPWQPSRVTGVYPASDAADGRAAVEAAGRAFPGGRRSRPRSGPPSSYKAATALEARAEQIAQDMTAEMGKPLREARMEAMRARHHPPLRRRRGLAADRRGLRALGNEPAALHAPPAARRRRADHPLELPDRDSRLEARPGARSTATRSC